MAHFIGRNPTEKSMDSTRKDEIPFLYIYHKVLLKHSYKTHKVFLFLVVPIPSPRKNTDVHIENSFLLFLHL